VKSIVKPILILSFFAALLVSCHPGKESTSPSETSSSSNKHKWLGSKAVVIAPVLDLRSKPKEGSLAITAEPLVYQCSLLTVDEESGDWLKVTTEQGNSGYLLYEGEKGEPYILPLAEFELNYITALDCLATAEAHKGELSSDSKLVGIWGQAMINGRAKSWVFHYFSPSIQKYMRLEVTKDRVIAQQTGGVELTAFTSGAIYPPISGGTTFELPGTIIDSDLVAQVATDNGAKKFLEERGKYYTQVICCYYVGYPSYPGGASVRWNVAFDAGMDGAHSFVIGPTDTTYYGQYDCVPKK
jgi:hypothetical protein